MLRLRLQAFVVVLALVGAAVTAAAQTVPAPPEAPAPDGPPPSPADAFFDDTVLHDLYLFINSRDWQNLGIHYLDNTYYPCDMKWRDQVVRNIGIRSRGTGSRNSGKPGLRVDFNRYTTDQKFLGLKSFVLRNNTQDPSGMHERLSMLLYRRLGVAAPREAHAKLYVNNQFLGLYTIVESIDKSFLQRSYNEDGGYLYKYDYNVDDQPYYLDYRGADPALYVPHPFKPETHELDSQPEQIAELIRILNRDGDSIFRSTVAPFIDFSNFIKHIAVEIFVADRDGFNGNYGTNNFYLYRYQNSHLFKFIPWDKSEAFKDGPTYPVWHNILDVPPSQRNVLTVRMLSYADLRNQFLDALAACANAATERDATNPQDTRGWLEREIEREYAQISAWAAVGPQDAAVYSKDQFEQEVENLRAFARDRSPIVMDAVRRARDAFSLAAAGPSVPAAAAHR
jgi:hypothetical protein